LLKLRYHLPLKPITKQLYHLLAWVGGWAICNAAIHFKKYEQHRENLGFDNWFKYKVDLSKTAEFKIARVVSELNYEILFL
jgi:hypothetical protein